MRIARNPPTPTSLSYSENMAVYYLFDNQGLKKRSPFPTLENAPKYYIFYSVVNYFPREATKIPSGGNKFFSEGTLQPSLLSFFLMSASSISLQKEVLNSSNFFLHLPISLFFPFYNYSNSKKKTPQKLFTFQLFFLTLQHKTILFLY